MTLLRGWGRTSPSAAHLEHVQDAAQVDELLTAASGPLLARGLGRSYGDAAQCAGGTVLDMTLLSGVLESDLEKGWIRVAGGTSLQSLMVNLVPRGWALPVVPGTQFVTVGGAIAADIHGKNHHRDGSFCAHVTALSLSTPTGRYEVSAESDPELFWATAGGMGLTGVVVEATIRLIPIESAYVLVDTERASDLDDCMARMTERDAQYRYSVAWVDCQARGLRMGRAVITRGDYATAGSLPPRLASDPLSLRAVGGDVKIEVPADAPSGMLNPLTMSLFNELWFRKAPRIQVAKATPMGSFFHPLDAVGSWNRLYGPQGFVQHQFVVPFGREAIVRIAIERLRAARASAFLAVLKRFGEGDAGHMSFPQAGWTLAVDIPLGPPDIASALDAIDEDVAQAGGRVYLAKDGRLAPWRLRTMYPRVDEWREVCRRVDPKGVMVSDLARRFGIAGEPRGNPKGKSAKVGK